MTDIGERVRFLVANSTMTHRAAELFIAEILEIGAAAAACREKMFTNLAVERAKRSSELYIVAKDEGGKNSQEGGK